MAAARFGDPGRAGCITDGKLVALQDSHFTSGGDPPNHAAERSLSLKCQANISGVAGAANYSRLLSLMAARRVRRGTSASATSATLKQSEEPAHEDDFANRRRFDTSFDNDDAGLPANAVKVA